MCLAANMKLVTNSNETLGMENIDFDTVSARIYEEANESLHGDFDDLDNETYYWFHINIDDNTNE